MFGDLFIPNSAVVLQTPVKMASILKRWHFHMYGCSIKNLGFAKKRECPEFIF
jgi:hypothetical protein